MANTIFKDTAPAYYAKGVSVIPLRVHEKRPFTNGWQHYHNQEVSQTQQTAWLNSYPTGNIGLVLGEQSGVCVIDIDTDDVEIIKIIEDIIPASPWKRVGKKGYVAAYKFNGTPTFRVDDKNGVRFVEHLSTRTQVVLPPSIHPDTGKPYVANCELLSVIDSLPTLPQDIESILRSAFELEGRKLSTNGWTKMTSYVSSGSRDTQMIRVAGLGARGVVRGETTFKRALEDMVGWYESRVEKVAGDDIDIEKGLRRLAEYVRSDVEKGRQLPVGWDEDMTKEQLAEYGLSFTEDDQQWEFEKLRDYIHEQFSIHPEKSTGRIQAVDKVMKKMSSNKMAPKHAQLSALEENILLDTIKSGFGKGLSYAAMRKQIAEFSAGPVEGTDHSQIARAVLRDIQRDTNLRHHNGSFWSWEGSHWEPYEKQNIRVMISQNYGDLPYARKSSDHKGILDIIEQLCPQDLKDIDIQGVNFANGVFTEDGKLVDHKPEYGFTYTLPYRYLPDDSHRCEQFMRFLETCWGRDKDFEDKKLALQEAICATVFGWSPRYQKVFCLYGVARSGKSQLLEIVEGLVPSNSVSSVSFDKWADGPSLVALDGKLVNIVGELAIDANIRSDIFNKVVVGEPISLRQLYGQTYLTRLRAGHWIGSNHPPSSKDPSEGFNRRWLYFKFNYQVRPEDIIPNIGRKIIAEEREAILAWAMEARARLTKQHGYTLSESHKEFTATVAGYNDSIRFFVTDSGKVQTLGKDEDGKWIGNPISDVQFHDAYSSYCITAAGVKPVSIRSFKLRLHQLAQSMGWERVVGESQITGEKVALYYGVTLATSKAKKL